MSSGSISKPPPERSSDDSASVAISEALRALWHKRRPEVVADLEALLALLDDLARRADLTHDIAAAQAMAHRLHGTFGVFGWTVLKNELGAIEQALLAGDVAFGDHVNAVQRVLAELP